MQPSLSHRLSALSEKALRRGPAQPRNAIRILPLPAASVQGSRGAVATGAAAARFLLVVPPFAVAMDGLGQPDPMHGVLDIAQSLDDTPLGGEAVTVCDAAVAADKLLLSLPSWLLMCGAHLCGLSIVHSMRQSH
jgi:hypothetical protein